MTKHTLKNITYDLVKMEKALVFQVLEQDKSWRCKKKSDKPLIFKCSEVINYEGYGPSFGNWRKVNEHTRKNRRIKNRTTRTIRPSKAKS